MTDMVGTFMIDTIHVGHRHIRSYLLLGVKNQHAKVGGVVAHAESGVWARAALNQPTTLVVPNAAFVKTGKKQTQSFDWMSSWREPHY